MSDAELGSLPPDPMEDLTIAGFAREFRAGRASSEAITRTYLQRIALLDGRLGSYQHVEQETALRAARQMDERRRAGVDLGPLMGVPVAIKDIFAVAGMPTTAGSRLDVTDAIGTEGPVVQRLRSLGCVILGKTKTVEFAFGPAGTNEVLGTPVNPWDPVVHRIPGGSSSGSAVAVAAGLCAFSLASDTGGSVRVPAALCGIFGLKLTAGRCSMAGAFPLAPTLDSPALLTRSAADAALVYAALCRRQDIGPAKLDGLRLGRSDAYFLVDLQPEVKREAARALARLGGHGVRYVERAMANLEHRTLFNRTIVTSELLATLGRERAIAEQGAMDPVVAQRLRSGFDLSCDEYDAMLRRHAAMKTEAAAEMADLDAWVAPTIAVAAPPLLETLEPEKGSALAAHLTRNTGPMNMFGQCGFSMPIQSRDARLPVGLQITCSGFEEEKALSIALALENALGAPVMPDMTPFTGAWTPALGMP